MTLTININKGKHDKCLVPGCTGGSKDKFGMYRHFAYWHPEVKIRKDEDGELQQFKLCGMFSKDIEKHQKSKKCENLRKRRVNETNQDRQEKANEIKFCCI